MHNPKLAKVIGPLGAYFRTGYSLSEREREIAVCIINSKWLSIYPTNAPRARRQGGRLAGRHGRGALVRSVGLVLRQAGFYTRVSMTLAFYDVPAGAIGMAARACELDEILDIAVLFSLPWVFISPCASSSPVRWVRIGGGLIPGTHSVPGAIGHPTHDFKG